jgi:hypothetical protein
MTRTYSYKTVEQRFWKRVKKGLSFSCWPWLGTKTKGGYGVVNFKRERTTAHRIAYKLTKGEIPKGYVVMHNCDTRDCCNPRHLRAATQRENLEDMWKKRRQGDYRNFGTANGRCKVTTEQCAEIQQTYKEGWITAEALGKLFGLGQSQILRIVNGESRVKVSRKSLSLKQR